MGRLQARGGVLDIAGTPGTRVGTMSVAEGQSVRRGDVLFVLDTYPILAANAEAAEARLRDAQAALELEVRQGAALQRELELDAERARRIDPLDLQSSRSQVAIREQARDKAKADLARLTTLRQKGSGAVSEQELEASRLATQSAEAELEEARVQQKKLEAAQDLGKDRRALDSEKLGVANDRARLAAQLDSARAASEAARQQRDAARVLAPRDGQILRVVTREGESVGGQPVLQMGDTDHMMVVAEVSELDILRLREAAARGPVAASVEALGRQLQLKGRAVEAGIGRMVGKNRLSSLNPAIQTDDRVVEVEVELEDGPASSKAGGLSNLQVDVTFPLDGSTGARERP